MNPFLEKYNTPHSTAPFDKIKFEDYEPAMMQGIKEEDEEIARIISNPEFPTFQNTIEALENTGELLGRVTEIFFNLLSAETTDEMDELAQKMSPILSEHSNNISLNPDLFRRIQTVYEEEKARGFANLDAEQKKLLIDNYEGFVRRGANLPDDKKEQLRKVNSELGVLSLQFSQNKLKDTNAYKLHIQSLDEIKGLPESALDLAKDTAKEEGLDGYVFSLQAPSYGPFLTYCENRELRRQMWTAYNTICTKGETSNVDIVKKIVNLHRELAQILGYESYADYVLVHRMAENQKNVYNLLNNLIDAYMPTAKEEVAEVEKMAKETEGEDFEMMPWDFGFYANKLKEKKYNINSEVFRPYLELSNVKAGVFGLAERLYGIKFVRNNEIPVYHPDVEAYDVIDKDGSFLAVFYCDFHPRKSKKSGAWMTSFKDQWKEMKALECGSTELAEINSRPHVSIVMNLSKPTADKPALLTLGEVETFLHEFGHSLHGMFANTHYRSLSGTNVYWDFVELPSQIMENFCTEPEFLNTFAKHYQTGESLPQELIDRLKAASNFNVAYACMRQVSFGLLDMAYYTLTEPFDTDVEAFEKEAWQRAQVLPQVPETCMTVQFSHIMAGGYSAGYYSYKWAEVLDADAFSLFKEKGIFSLEVAQSFRDNILSQGATQHPAVLYRNFRGQNPTIDALLKRNGIK